MVLKTAAPPPGINILKNMNDIRKARNFAPCRIAVKFRDA